RANEPRSAQFSLTAPPVTYVGRLDLNRDRQSVYDELTLTTGVSPFYNPGGLFGTGALSPRTQHFLQVRDDCGRDRERAVGSRRAAFSVVLVVRASLLCESCCR